MIEVLIIASLVIVTYIALNIISGIVLAIGVKNKYNKTDNKDNK